MSIQMTRTSKAAITMTAMFSQKFIFYTSQNFFGNLFGGGQGGRAWHLFVSFKEKEPNGNNKSKDTNYTYPDEERRKVPCFLLHWGGGLLALLGKPFLFSFYSVLAERSDLCYGRLFPSIFSDFTNPCVVSKLLWGSLFFCNARGVFLWGFAHFGRIVFGDLGSCLFCLYFGHFILSFPTKECWERPSYC